MKWVYIHIEQYSNIKKKMDISVFYQDQIYIVDSCSSLMHLLLLFEESFILFSNHGYIIGPSFAELFHFSNIAVNISHHTNYMLSANRYYPLYIEFEMKRFSWILIDCKNFFGPLSARATEAFHQLRQSIQGYYTLFNIDPLSKYSLPELTRAYFLQSYLEQSKSTLNDPILSSFLEKFRFRQGRTIYYDRRSGYPGRFMHTDSNRLFVRTEYQELNLPAAFAVRLPSGNVNYRANLYDLRDYRHTPALFRHAIISHDSPDSDAFNIFAAMDDVQRISANALSLDANDIDIITAVRLGFKLLSAREIIEFSTSISLPVPVVEPKDDIENNIYNIFLHGMLECTDEYAYCRIFHYRKQKPANASSFSQTIVKPVHPLIDCYLQSNYRSTLYRSRSI